MTSQFKIETLYIVQRLSPNGDKGPGAPLKTAVAIIIIIIVIIIIIIIIIIITIIIIIIIITRLVTFRGQRVKYGKY